VIGRVNLVNTWKRMFIATWVPNADENWSYDILGMSFGNYAGAIEDTSETSKL
jgi:hypothetical protein